MLMMDVRVMRMAVGDRRMGVLVGMRLVPVPVEIVRVLMMLVMHVAMGVGDSLVGVQVFVALGEVQPDTGRHQRGSQPEHP